MEVERHHKETGTRWRLTDIIKRRGLDGRTDT